MNKNIRNIILNKTLILLSLSFIIIFSIIIEYIYILERTYQNEKDQVFRESNIAVDAFEQHTAQIINQGDLLLRSIRMVHLLSLSRKETEDFIKGLNLDTTVFENIFLVKSDGTFMIPYDDYSKIKTVKDREYFKYHQTNPVDSLFISAVERGYISGKDRFRITRRINNADGTFGGVIIVTINPKSFLNYFNELKNGSQNFAMLIGTRDKKIRMRIPWSTDEIWSEHIQSYIFDKIKDSITSNFQYKIETDNIQRFFKYKKVKNLPLLVIVGFSDLDIKNRIQKQKSFLLAINLISIFFTIIITLILLWLIKEEARRQKIEIKYRRIVNTANEGILSLDNNSRITFVNQQLASMLGYTIEEMLGKEYSSFFPEDQLIENEAQMKIRSQGQDAVYERCFLRKDGSKHWILVSAKSVLDSNGKFEGSFAMFTDINKRKRLEAEKEVFISELAEKNTSLAKLNATKDRFFGIIAHDLRGPLGTFKQLAGIMLDKFDQITEEKKIQYISLLKDNANNVFSLLENLLTWSQSQRDDIQPKYEEINLKSVIDKTLQLLHVTAYSKRISLTVNFEGHETIATDLHLFTTILRNLVSNAIKFTQKGGNITVKTENLNNYIRISVQDSGIGINPDDINKLFQMHTKISTNGTSGEKGTGLGLILCKELAEKIGGKIEVKSIVNKGTTFSIILPVNQN